MAVPRSGTVAAGKQSHVHGEILTAPAMDAHNTFDAPRAVHPTSFNGAGIANGTLSLTLPAKSVVVLRLE
jgi:alpha-N-arabinofuranosidase